MAGKQLLLTTAFVFALAVPTARVKEPVPTSGALANVSGRVNLLVDAGPTDVGTAVVWLEGPNALGAPAGEFRIITSDKQFAPRVIIVPVGSTVSFPNNDPFNHNVFSRSRGGQFDLGLYSRGTERSTGFTLPGVVKIYCNVHPGMSSLVHVRQNRHFAQPGSDGSFTLEAVPSGTYNLHVWHERASEEAVLEITLTGAPLTGVDIELDARGYRFVLHENKYGRPYSRSSRRY